MNILWTSAEASAATGGRMIGDKDASFWQAGGVSIDTRSLQPGDLFVALTDVRDGHDFVAAAFERGAAAALVSRIPEGMLPHWPLLLVEDVLTGLQALGQAARQRTRARVIGVTGSVGKTSTKEMLRAVLGGQGRVHAAEASYNNHWGVPLTLARMPRDCDFAVIEIGMNHPGEIAPLARLARLDAGLITTVAPAHLEAFEDVAGIAREKASILEGVVPGGVAILPSDLDVSDILMAKAAALGLETLTFGTVEGSDFHLRDAQIHDDTTVVQAARGAEHLVFKVNTPGRHFGKNGLAVLALAHSLGLDPAIAAADLGRWSPPAGRGLRERILIDQVEETYFDLWDDAFNANPASMAAALEVLIAAVPQDDMGRMGKGRRLAILGDMLELGASELDLHRAISLQAGFEKIDVIHTVGPRMAHLHALLPRRQRGECVAAAKDLAGLLRGLVDAGDVILVKGSKGSKVSILVDGLRKLGQPAPSHEGEA